MKPEPPPEVKGKTDWERFDNAVKKVFSVPKEELDKQAKKHDRKPKRKAA